MPIWIEALLGLSAVALCAAACWREDALKPAEIMPVGTATSPIPSTAMIALNERENILNPCAGRGKITTDIVSITPNTLLTFAGRLKVSNMTSNTFIKMSANINRSKIRLALSPS